MLRAACICAAFTMTVFIGGNVHAEKSFWAPNGEATFTGTSIDFTTGKPLPRIWVMAVYILGAGGIHEQAHCSVLEVVRSDAMGHYTLPFYNGLPPQFLEAFGSRYVLSGFGRVVTKDKHLRWIVETLKPGPVYNEVIGVEGPFSSEREALKASRMVQDVWLKPFNGSDDEWLKTLMVMTRFNAGCKSRQTRGGVQWGEALISEAELIADSPTRSEMLKIMHRTLDDVRSLDPEAGARGGPQ